MARFPVVGGSRGGLLQEEVPKMKRELVAIGIAVALLGLGQPTLAAVNLDQDWMDPGFTILYEAKNTDTGETLDFRVTIDDITNGVLRLDYWLDDNGNEDVFITTHQRESDRVDEDISTAETTWYSHFWVNAADVDDGVAKLDTRTFTLDPLALNTFKFDSADDSVHFHFHKTKGYLVKAVYDDSSQIIELQGTSHEAVPLDDLPSNHFNPADCHRDYEREDHATISNVIAVADAAVCMDADVSAGECLTESQGAVSIIWPMWRIITYDFGIRDHNSPPQGGVFTADLTNVPSEIKATPLSSDRRDAGFEAEAAGELSDLDLSLFDIPNTVAKLTC